jgi:Ca-activated chloride channel family protein
MRAGGKGRAFVKLTAATCLGVVFTAGADGQQNAPIPANSFDNGPSVIRVMSQFVLLDAQVEERKSGNPVGDLKAKDFLVTEDGHPQNVSYFSSDELPLAVVFLFDLTDTVRPVLRPLADEARQMLGHLKPQDEAAVMVFSSHAELLQGFTTDRAAAAAAIAKASKMKSKDGTFIDEDMYEAAREAMRATTPESRRVMVWLTDGTANFENSFTRLAIGREAPDQLHSKEEATRELFRSGAVVEALIERSEETDEVTAGRGAGRFSFVSSARIGDIDRYAEATGGLAMEGSGRHIAAQLAALIERLRERYTLGYAPSSPKPEGSFCKLKVRLAATAYQDHPELRKSDLVVRTKRGYYR